MGRCHLCGQLLRWHSALALSSLKAGVPVAFYRGMAAGGLQGNGCVKWGPRDLGCIPYRVEVGAGGQASIVKFAHRPRARNGARLHLTLEDGRMLDCQLLDASPYCAVLGEGPYLDRRAEPRDAAELGQP